MAAKKHYQLSPAESYFVTQDQGQRLLLPFLFRKRARSLKQWDVASMSGCTVNHCKRLVHSRMLSAGQEEDSFPTFLCLFISPLRYITLYYCVKRQIPAPFLPSPQDFSEIVRQNGCHLLTFELKINPQKFNS